MSPFYLVLYIFIALIVLLCVVSFAMYMCHVCSGVCGGEDADFEPNVYMDEVQPLSGPHAADTNLNEPPGDEHHEGGGVGLGGDKDDPDHVVNVRDFARKLDANNHTNHNNHMVNHNSSNHVGNNHNGTNHHNKYSNHNGHNHMHSDTDERGLPPKPPSDTSDVTGEAGGGGNNRRKYNAPPIPPKPPSVPVMIHSQPSSKKNSAADPPPYGLFSVSTNSTPYRTSSCATPDSGLSPSRSSIVQKRKPPPPPPPPPPKPILSDDDFLEQLPPPRDSMLPPPDVSLLRDSIIDSILPPPPQDVYLSDDSSFRQDTDNYLSDCD